MLLDHYGLREQPFGVTPNPRFLFLSPSHREALASLVYGIESGRGFLGLIAPPGMGKTTLLFQLLERLGSTARTVFLFQAQCNSREFMRSLMHDLGVGAEGGDDVVSLQARLNEILIEEMRARRKFVLVVDEAQNLEDSALEYVRMLSNFETSREKLMHIILAGQPQLAEKLARPSMMQLRQRISMLLRLRPLSTAETGEYIEHRLRVAGYRGLTLFNGGAVEAIASLSGGIPRNVNNICFNALSLGYAGGRKTIDSAVIREVACDMDLSFFAEQAASLADAGAARKDADPKATARSGADGWAVMLDRILTPAPPPRWSLETAEARKAGERSLDLWSESWGWKEAFGTLANRLSDRIVH
jgi:general secretion pathway protein A